MPRIYVYICRGRGTTGHWIIYKLYTTYSFMIYIWCGLQNKNMNTKHCIIWNPKSRIHLVLQGQILIIAPGWAHNVGLCIPAGSLIFFTQIRTKNLFSTGGLGMDQFLLTSIFLRFAMCIHPIPESKWHSRGTFPAVKWYEPNTQRFVNNPPLGVSKGGTINLSPGCEQTSKNVYTYPYGPI